MLAQLYSVIVNWNLKNETIACIDSLLMAGMQIKNVLLVDNASTDGSPQVLREKYGPELSVIENIKNIGYAGGLNIGIQNALDLGAEWLLLLNNDVLAAPNLFEELDYAHIQSPATLIWSPIIHYANDRDRIWAVGDRLIPGTLLTVSSGRNQLNRQQLPPVVPVDFITGCAMLVHRSVFEQSGVFPTEYFMYAEEVDFLWRARLAGYRPAVATRAVIWHKVSASSSTEPAQKRYWKIYNQIRFYRKHGTMVQKIISFIYTFVRSLIIAVRYLFQDQESSKLCLLAWLNGWFEKSPDALIRPAKG